MNRTFAQTRMLGSGEPCVRGRSSCLSAKKEHPARRMPLFRRSTRGCRTTWSSRGTRSRRRSRGTRGTRNTGRIGCWQRSSALRTSRIELIGLETTLGASLVQRYSSRSKTHIKLPYCDDPRSTPYSIEQKNTTFSRTTLQDALWHTEYRNYEAHL